MAKRRLARNGNLACTALGALDAIEPALRHLQGLIVAFRVLGEADDAMEPLAVSSLALSAAETLEVIQQNWRIAIESLREQ